jgi:preprotein translocase subunit SecG
MLIAILTILHIIMCIVLILIVLLQTGKGSELAGAFGGGTSNTAFGVTGAISFIGKMTTAAAFCFLFTSFSLSLLPIGNVGSSVIKEEATPGAQQAPANDASKGLNKTDGNVPANSKPGVSTDKKTSPAESKPADNPVNKTEGAIPAGSKPADNAVKNSNENVTTESKPVENASKDTNQEKSKPMNSDSGANVDSKQSSESNKDQPKTNTN